MNAARQTEPAEPVTRINPADYRGPFAVFLKIDAPDPKQLAEARAYARESMIMHVGASGVWSGRFPDLVTSTATTTRSVSSYERLGYHTGTDHFLRAFLEAGGTCYFHGFRGIIGRVSL